MSTLVRSSSDIIAVIGMGYVGLPLAMEFAKKYAVIGFDINQERIEELKKGYDRTNEISRHALKNTLKLIFTFKLAELQKANIYIITVPTPIDKYKKPDLSSLKEASKVVGKFLKQKDIVVYESTVYPGCTEEECVPILEKYSKLKFNRDFCVGYSPERINPGDRKHTVCQIKKIVSGSTPETANHLNKLYSSIIKAGTYLTSSIQVAEAAKVIENAQRDLNIAFMNELAIIFEKMSINTSEVLEAANTKWNFLPFKPGLVGGHCIGVDPYYLTYKAESLGYRPEIILSGRRINDNMGVYIADRVINSLKKKKRDYSIKNTHILVLGITFKENCSDLRNTKVVDIVSKLQSFGIKVSIYDPNASPQEAKDFYGLELISKFTPPYAAAILAVAHQNFKTLPIKQLLIEDGILFDVKSFYDRSIVDESL